MATAAQLEAMKRVRDTIATGQGATLNARNPITFGKSLQSTLSSPAANAPLNFNQTIPAKISSAGVNFNVPGISSKSSTTPVTTPALSSTRPAKTVDIKSGYVLPGVPGLQPGEIKPSDIPVNIPTGYRSTQSSSFSAPQGVNVPQSVSFTGGKGMLPDGTWDPNYTPGSEAEAFQSGVDAYTRKKWLENYYKSRGLKFTADMPGTFDDEAKSFLEEQQNEQSLLDYQIKGAVNKAERQAKEQQAASDVALSSSREGVASLSNVAAKQDIRGFIRGEVEDLKYDLEIKKQRLTQLQKDQQQKYIAGREEQIRAQMIAVSEAEAEIAQIEEKQRQSSLAIIGLLQKDNALASLDDASLAFLQEGLPGVPDGVIQALTSAATRNVQQDERKEQFDNQMTALSTFKGLVTEGIQITPQLMMKTAQETGIPMESIFDFNMKAQQVMGSKELDDTQKFMEVQKLGYELDRQARGITNAELEKVDYIASLYKKGASKEEIILAKRMLGVKDADDPMYQAEVAYKSAQAKIEQSRAKGEAVTPQDQLALASALEKLQELNGAPTTVTPGGKGKYNVAKTEYGIKVDAQIGGKGGQCGKFVNDVFGKRIIGDSYEQKLSLTDPSIVVPVPGMAFVQPVKSGPAAKYGHTGIVEQVDYKGGRMLVIDSNAKGDEKINEYWMPIASATGFIVPPDPVIDSGRGGKDGKITKDVNYFYTQLVEGGADVSTVKRQQKVMDEALKLASEQLKKSDEDEGDKYEIMADNIMTPLSGFTMVDIPQEDRPKVAAILTKKKQEAMKKGDLMGVVAASAGGKELDSTALQSLEKARTVKDQLDLLVNDLTNTPITKIGSVDIQPVVGIVQSVNPYETKAQLLKAQLRAIVPNLARGIYGEVGVLTDNDIKNYIETIPNINSTADVREALANMTRDLVVKSIKRKLDTQARGGRDVSAFADVLIDLDPSLSGTSNVNKSPGFFNQFLPQKTNYTDYYNSIEYEDANY